MKILSAGIQHETNTFAQNPTTLQDFIRDSHLDEQLTGGDLIIQRYAGTQTIHGGYLAGAKEAGFELVPVLNAKAYPSGMVDKESFDFLKSLMVQRIRKALPAEGILLDLHGAMVTEEHQDAEAELIRAVREVVGQNFPIVVTLDLHANISPSLAERSTAIIGFQTYPHVDMGNRGRDAALLLARIIQDGVKPVQVYRQLPLLTMPPMQCTLREPMQSLMRKLRELESLPGMLSATIAMGFPFADINDMGATVLATSDDNLQLAEIVADQLASALWDLREDLQPRLTTISDAMQIARESEGLVVFADGSDNPGGGAPCDGTVAMRAMIEADFQGGLVGLIYDPETAQQAVDAKVGQTISAMIGGKTDDRHGSPMEVEAEVLALSDGQFTYVGEMAKGLADTLGPTALLRVGGVEIVVCSIRRQLSDRAMLSTVHADPSTKKLLVVKSAVHFRADIGPLAETILDGDTPGIHRPDFAGFAYQNVRRPVFPLDAIDQRE